MKAYENMEYPAKDHVNGYCYSSGTTVICPFDWRLENEDFEYSFDIVER